MSDHLQDSKARKIPVLSGISQCVDMYDGFVIDLWGVLHDGVNAFEGARETLEKLKGIGKKTVLLSNAPQLSPGLITMMEGLGLPRDCYGAIVSSGDAVHKVLRERSSPEYAQLGRKVFFIGPDRALTVLEGLDYTVVDVPDAADFYLCSGPWDLGDELSTYIPLIEQCIKNPQPMICANPDRAVIRDGKVVVCAGNIVDLYKERGGLVHEIGKPDPAVYDLALQAIGLVDRSRVAGIGDSFATDMRGCNASGISGLLCARGIHAKDFGVTPGQAPTEGAVLALARQYDAWPEAVIPAFVW